MKVKFKLSVMMIAIMLVIVAGIALLLLRQASGMTLDLSLRGIAYLATQQAEYWKSREDGYIRAIRTLANIMADYEDTPAEIRRDRFDGMLLGTIMSEPMLVTLYTIWKPNAIDGMDDAFVGRAGSSPSGQYAMAYTREYGQLQARSSVDIENAMAYFNGSNSKKDRVDDPFFRAIGGKETRMVRIMVPIVNPRTNETVGGVGLLLDTGAIQRGLEEVIASRKEIALMAIYSNDGFILAHFLPDRIGKMMLDVDKEYGEYARAAYKAIQDGTRFRCGVYDNALETRVELVLEPFTLGASDRSWTVLLGSAESYVLKEVNALTKFTIILAAAAIAASAAIVFFSLSYSIKPLANVINVLKDISEGEGDLTRNIAVNSKDEVGDLARYFNATLEKIKRLVAAIKGRSEALSDIGGELAGNMTETAAAVNEIAATTQSVKGRVMNQSASVSQTNAAMEQITANIDKLNRHIESQAASVSQSSSSIEEMLANIQSVTQTLAKNADNMKNLAAASDVGRAGLQNVAADIQEIAHDSEGLLEINSVMQDIASQTNLLSMNAAIEAAHAGEAGRGFAVVADEIRKLAENSGGQSKTIGAVLKKITSSIEKIMISAGGALEKFGAMDDGIKTVSEQEGLIRGAMEEQAAGSKQILEAISQVNDVTRQVKNEAAEMLQGSREVIQESGNLEKATEEIAGGMNEMASGADQINAAVVRVNELTIQNRENIESLMREVSRFKVE